MLKISNLIAIRKKEEEEKTKTKTRTKNNKQTNRAKISEGFALFLTFFPRIADSAYEHDTDDRHG